MSWLSGQIRKGMNVRTYVLVGVLAGILIWLQSLDAKQKAIRAGAHISSPGAGQPAAALPVASGARKAMLAAVSPGWGADPFARRFSAVGDDWTAHPAPRGPARGGGETRATGLYLQGVISGPLGRTALINGNMYREGERIGTREVLQIGRRSVVLLDHGTVTTLTLKGDG